MSEGQQPRRTGLAEKSRLVWRAVAARGRQGTNAAQMQDRFAGQIDSVPLSTTMKTLKHCGYLRNNENGRWSTWWATHRVPLGEERPAWLDEEAAADEPQADKAALAEETVATARATAAPWPFGKLPSGIDIDRMHAAAPAPAPPAPPAAPTAPAAPAQAADAPPWFSLDSQGCLSLRADGLSGRLSAESTRVLFSWLDRLHYANLRSTVEVEA